MRVQSGCKINLGLQILDKREDGYHNLKTVFYPLSAPCDTLTIETVPDKGIAVSCSVSGIDPQNNTLTKAYTLYDAENPLPFGLKVFLEKGVPHGAGLGGGSANAAALLQVLQEKAEKPLPFARLAAIAAKIGADVPFFLYNTPCKAEGIGEILTPVALDLSAYCLLLIMPDIQISTAWAFKKLAEQKKLLTSKEEQDKNARSLLLGSAYMENDFERVVFKAFSPLGESKKILLANNAAYASLSGTGSSLFGLFEQEKDMKRALNKLTEQKFFKNWKHCCFEKVK